MLRDSQQQTLGVSIIVMPVNIIPMELPILGQLYT